MQATNKSFGSFFIALCRCAWIASALVWTSCVVANDWSWENPPGDRFDLGTHRLHIVCEGTALPAVIIDVGLGASSLEWLTLLKSLGTHQKTCVYDRAGYAWSDPGPEPRTSRRIVDELARLLALAEIPPPYVLVGHSFGGLNMQLFAALHPEITAGLVLFDASHPEQMERFARPPLNLNTAPRTRRGQAVFSEVRIPPALPEELKSVAMVFQMMAKTKHAIEEEYINMRQSAGQVADASKPDRLPLLVVTRGQGTPVRSPRDALIEDLWLQLQTELAGRSTLSAHLLALHSGHHIHLDQPGLVNDAIELVVDIARQTGRIAAPGMEPHWLAFANARWLSDRLPGQQALDPALRGRLAQNGLGAIGRMAAPYYVR